MKTPASLSPRCPCIVEPGVQRGFTLIELLITIIIMGILSLVWASETGGAFTAMSNAQDTEQEALNKRLGSVLINYAATVSPTGTLPTPYTSGNTRFAINDVSNAPLQALLVEARILPLDANGDDQDVRVYQTATGLTTTLPLYNTFGPIMTLNYVEAVILSTHCPRADTCNTTGTNGIPGASGLLTGNLNTYRLLGNDYGLTRITTLSIQKQKLSQTADNIDAIRTRMQELFRERQRTADANDTTNFFPRQIAPIVPAAAMGNTTDCHNDGWYRLDNSNILQQIGLIPATYGLTAWGGQIHYCPDYDPTTLAAADAPPHFAALRILTNPTAGGSPPYASSTGTTIIPF